MCFDRTFLPRAVVLCVLLLASAVFGDDGEKREIYVLKAQLKQQEEDLKTQDSIKARGGFFAGAILGNVTFKNTPRGHIDVHPLLYGARAGYQKYLNNRVAGLRFYGEYMRADNLNGLSYWIGSVNLDLLADVPLDAENKYAIGVFGGVGMGASEANDVGGERIAEGLGIVVNLGVALTLDVRHRIEVSMKMPPFVKKETPSGRLDLSDLWLVSYNYVF